MIALRRPRPDAAVRICCFPYAGGEARIFRAWQDLLPREAELVPLEYPGHGTRLREPLVDRIAAVADEAARALDPLGDRPLILYGHSMGALVAFEAARRLQRRDPSAPSLLVAAACKAPPHVGPIEALHPPTRDEFFAALERYYATPFEAFRFDELKELYWPILKNDLRAYEAYPFAGEPRLRCPVVAIGGQHDPTVTEEELQAWKGTTSSRFTMRWLPGGHFFVHGRLVLRELARLVQEMTAAPLTRTAP